MKLNWREIVSRGAMLVMGAGVVVVGIAVLRTSSMVFPYEHSRWDQSTVAKPLFTFGWALIGVGAFLIFSAFRPSFRGEDQP